MSAAGRHRRSRLPRISINARAPVSS
jgi:hypothetical protein